MTDTSASTHADRAGPVSMILREASGRSWRLEGADERITLASDDDVLVVPRDAWSRDMYVAPHAGGYIVRFETFDRSVGFLVSGAQAAPLLELLGYRPERTKDEPTSERSPAADASARTELLWPKVSPLAVWALICAAPSFIPLIGLPFALSSVVLLLLHRRKVHRSNAWRHSRMLCGIAMAFLAIGLPVSGLACAVWVRMASAPRSVELPVPDVLERGGAVRAGVGKEQAEAVQRAGFFDEEHNWGLIGAALVVVLLSLTIHEGAHAISAWWLGDDFARRLGRVTLNPLAHIDPVGTVLLPLILALANLGVFGWARPVPVRTEALPNPRQGHILIALAGPGSNLLLAAASLMLLLGVGCGVALMAPEATIENLISIDFTQSVTASGFALAPIAGPLCTVLKLSFLINTFLAFFNLIPIPPLDGSWVLEHSFPRTVGPFYARVRPYAFLVFVALLYTKVLVFLLIPAYVAITAGLELIGIFTPYV